MQREFAEKINPFKLVPVIHDDAFILPERFATFYIIFCIYLPPSSVTKRSAVSSNKPVISDICVRYIS